jgi:hypothetical protein
MTEYVVRFVVGGIVVSAEAKFEGYNAMFLLLAAGWDRPS